MKKLIKVTLVFVLTLFLSTSVLQADVILEGPNGSLHKFTDFDCCSDVGDMPEGWDCYDNCD